VKVEAFAGGDLLERRTSKVLVELEEALVAEGFTNEAAKEPVDSFESAILDLEDEQDGEDSDGEEVDSD